MVGSDYEHGRNERARKHVVAVFDADGRRLGPYPIRSEDGGYQLEWKDVILPVRKGTEGHEKGRFYLMNRGDAERLRRQ